jgi:hypothetical protein
MFCSKCGNQRKENDKFCAKCGASFNNEANTATTTQSTPALQKYDKIGGWLVLVAIGLFITPFLLAYGVFDSVSLLSDGGLEVMNSVVPGLGSAIAFELVLDTILVFVALYLIFLFKDKKKTFPKYYIWYLGASVAYLILDYIILASLSTTNSEMQAILNSTLEESLGSLIGTTIVSAIWIAYMLKSKRVAGTFTK